MTECIIAFYFGVGVATHAVFFGIIIALLVERTLTFFFNEE